MESNVLLMRSARVDRETYFSMASSMLRRLTALYPNNQLAVVSTPRNRAEFRCLEILIDSDGVELQKVASKVDSVEMVCRNDVMSLGILVRPIEGAVEGNVFQVDIISQKLEGFDFREQYHNHDGLGDLLGHIAVAAGLHLGPDGLYYRMMNDTDNTVFREICLTHDYDEALAFMGYDPERYRRGFNDENDLYEYVTKSPFFHKTQLKEVYGAHDRGLRHSGRAVFQRLLRWLESHRYVDTNAKPVPAFWQQRLMEFFPGFTNDLAKAKHDLKMLKSIAGKYNEEVVRKVTGVSGDAVRKVMQGFQAGFASPNAFTRFIMSSPDEVLASALREYMTSGAMV